MLASLVFAAAVQVLVPLFDADDVAPAVARRLSELYGESLPSAGCVAEGPKEIGPGPLEELSACLGRANCLAAIGRRRGADVVLSALVSRTAAAYSLSIVVIEAASGRAMTRLTETVSSAPAVLPAAVRGSAARVCAAVKPKETELALADLDVEPAPPTPAPPPDDAPPPLEALAALDIESLAPAAPAPPQAAPAPARRTQPPPQRADASPAADSFDLPSAVAPAGSVAPAGAVAAAKGPAPSDTAAARQAAATVPPTASSSAVEPSRAPAADRAPPVSSASASGPASTAARAPAVPVAPARRPPSVPAGAITRPGPTPVPPAVLAQRRRWGWMALGGAAVAATLGATLGGWSAGIRRDDQVDVVGGRQMHSITRADALRSNSLAIGANVAFVLAGVFGAGGGGLLVSSLAPAEVR